MDCDPPARPEEVGLDRDYAEPMDWARTEARTDEKVLAS